MSVISNNQLAGAAGQGGDAGYKIDRSLRFNSGDSAYLNRTPSSAGNRKTFTWSGWVKRVKIPDASEAIIFGAGSGNMNLCSLSFETDDNLRAMSYNGSYVYQKVTNAVFRDPSAWYHIVYAVDTTNSTAEDRVKLYVNGERITSFSTNTNPAQNADVAHINSTSPHYINKYITDSNYGNVYLADVHFIDGQVLAATDFGEPDDNGVWQPKEFDGSYTTTNTSTTLSQTGWDPSTTSAGSHIYIWDGGTTNKAYGYNGGTIGTVTFSPALTGVTKVECYTQNYKHYLNGSEITTDETVNGGWHTYYDNSSTPITLNSVGNAYDNNTQTVDLYAIRINGTIIDSSTWTPPSGVGVQGGGENSFYLKFADNSSNASLGTDSSGESNTWTVNNLIAGDAGTTVSAATGALPILNTSGDHGGTATSGVRSDSDSSNIVLALPLNGSNNGTTITDYHHTVKGSGSAKTVSIFTGDASGGAVTSTAQSKYYGSSFYAVRGATNDYDDSDHLYLTGDSDLSFGTGSFCVEFWYYPTSLLSNCGIFDNRHPSTDWPNDDNGFALVVNGSGDIFSYSNGNQIINHSSKLTANKWNHIAYTRDGTTERLFVNGDFFSTTATSSRDYNRDRFYLGTTANNGEGSNGYYADLRIYKGTAKYTSNFTVPAKSDYTNSDSLIDSPTDYTASGNNGGNYATFNSISPVGRDCTFSNGNLEVVISDGYSSTNNDGIRAVSSIGMTSGKFYFEHEITGGSTGRSNVGVVNNIADYGFGGNHWIGSGAGDYIVWSNNGEKYNNGSGSSYGDSWTTGDIIGCAFDADNGNLYIYKNGTVMNSGTPAFTGLTNGPYFFIAAEKESNITANFGQRPFQISSVPTGYKALCTTNLPNPTIKDGSTVFAVKKFNSNNSSQSISLGFSPDLVWTKSRANAYNHQLFDRVRGDDQELRTDTADTSRDLANSLTFDSSGFTMPSNNNNANYGSNSAAISWAWDAGTTPSNPVGDIWQGGATKYIGIKFASASGGTVSYGQTSGSDTVEVWTSSDNSSWTQQGSTQTLSTGHTLTTSDQYVYIRNTSNATFSNWYAAATNGADGHYSSSTYPSGASWSGPGYTDHDWRQNGGTLNKDGSILSIVQTNPSAGLSITNVNFPTFSGTGTVGHGLNSAPAFWIMKDLGYAENWFVGHKSLGANKYLKLNLDSSATTSTTIFDNTLPSSTLFYTNSATLSGVGKYTMYLWSPVEGYSAFGSYTGNASTDGPFVYTGFKPKWVMIKGDNTSDWLIVDSTRDSINVISPYLAANQNYAENGSQAWDWMDFLSNGFKQKNNGSWHNGSGTTYYYAAFAEHPFKTARAF